MNTVCISEQSKVSTFVNIFQSIKLFADMVNLDFNEERLFVQGMDSSHVSIFEINIQKEWFDSYDVSNKTVLGVNCNILWKILHTLHAKHELKLCFESNADVMELNFSSPDTNVLEKQFSLPLLDIDSEIMEIPETQYTLAFSLESKQLKTIIDEMMLFNETVTFTCQDESIKISNTETTEASMSTSIPFQTLHDVSFDDDEVLEVSYNIKYLHHMTQLYRLSTHAKVFISSGIPLQISYLLDDSNSNNYIRFFLAPRIDD